MTLMVYGQHITRSMHFVLLQDFGVTNKSITIETRDPLMQSVPGQRKGLSFYDSKAANLAYCAGKTQQQRQKTNKTPTDRRTE